MKNFFSGCRTQILIDFIPFITSGTHADKIFYAWHKGLAYSQESNYRLSTFSNAYLKKGENDAIGFEPAVLKETSLNVFEINTETAISSTEIKDLNGRTIPTHTTISGNQKSIVQADLSGMSAGLYIIQLHHNNGVESIKLIVK